MTGSVSTRSIGSKESLRGQQALILVEADCAWRDRELARQIADRVHAVVTLDAAVAVLHEDPTARVM